MISEAIAKWLDNQVSIVPNVYYGNIPQSISARPVIVVHPTDQYDHGQTAKAVVPQKIESFCIRVVGTTYSHLSSPRDAILALLEAIATNSTPTTIGDYRCQGIIIDDVITSSVIYSKEVNDRRQPGAPEQDFTFCDIMCRASYHRSS